MDIKTILKKVKVSKLAILWKGLWSKEAVFDYLSGKANTLVCAIVEDPSLVAKYPVVEEMLERLYKMLLAVDWAVPEKWAKYYEAILIAVASLVKALDDGKVVGEEVSKMAQDFQIAYSMWMSE